MFHQDQSSVSATTCHKQTLPGRLPWNLNSHCSVILFFWGTWSFKASDLGRFISAVSGSPRRSFSFVHLDSKDVACCLWPLHLASGNDTERNMLRWSARNMRVTLRWNETTKCSQIGEWCASHQGGGDDIDIQGGVFHWRIPRDREITDRFPNTCRPCIYFYMLKRSSNIQMTCVCSRISIHLAWIMHLSHLIYHYIL